MIYLDTSVALAHLLAEDRQPPDTLWAESLVSSRLLEYEMWVRVHARGLTRTHAGHLWTLLGRIAFMDLNPHILTRALEPFPTPVRPAPRSRHPRAGVLMESHSRRSAASSASATTRSTGERNSSAVLA